MEENRRRFLAEEKVRILRKHLVEKAPISDVCDELSVNRAGLAGTGERGD